ncbi:3TM-type holin [Paracoccus sp. p4-l81]|uniref:3TM-type holin n=1 Tax=unclassified Paracoccus (in: a-proteobacteria) TaxID=2688777 RepID=UPI0035BB57D6
MTTPTLTPAFDRLIDAMNRLPRPLMTLGTVVIFAYSMADPDGFAARMRGLEQMPEAAWWLLGGVISFYFGAREAHYYRQARATPTEAAAPATASPAAPASAAAPPNAALAEWQAGLPQ